MVKLAKRTILRVVYPIALIYWYIVKPKTERAKVILVHNKQILLVKQSFHRKQWTLPGGGINVDEPPKEAAAREIKEELNLVNLDLKFLGLTDKKMDGRHDLLYIFQAEVTAKQIETIKVDGVEIIEARWFSWDNLPYLKPANQAIIELYDRF